MSKIGHSLEETLIANEHCSWILSAQLNQYTKSLDTFQEIGHPVVYDQASPVFWNIREHFMPLEALFFFFFFFFFES